MDIQEIMRRNEECGGYFFSEGALRFFKSRIHDEVYGSGYFVTSERPPYGPRAYTVRYAKPDGHIVHVSDFMAFSSRNGAHAAAARYAAAEVTA